MIKNFKEFLTERVYRDIVFHGTSSVFLRSILKTGLHAKPNQKVWDKDDDVSQGHSSRASLDGVYLTKNLLTSYSAAGNSMRKFGGNKLFVIVLFQPKSGLPDEDNIKFRIMGAVNATIGNTHESVVQERLADLLFHGVHSKLVKPFREEVIKRLVGGYFDDEKFQIKTDHLQDEMFFKLLKAELVRRTVHHITTSTLYKYSGFKHWMQGDYAPESERKIIKDFTDNLPTVAEVEKEFLTQLDVATRAFRKLVLNMGIMDNIRSLRDLSYSGRNKIVCVVEETKKNPGEMREKTILKVHYGQVPEEFLKQWERSIGDNYEITK